MSYPFLLEGGPNNLYHFSTANNIAYTIAFRPTPYGLGNDSPFADTIFELVLKVVNSPAGLKPPFDAMTASTVAAIVKDFYERSILTVTIYICDTSDRREKARWLKFNRWYDYFNASDYYRTDRAIIDEKEGVTYHCAIIIKAGNPNKLAIFEAFDQMMEGFNEPK